MVVLTPGMVVTVGDCVERLYSFRGAREFARSVIDLCDRFEAEGKKGVRLAIEITEPGFISKAEGEE
jgi:hypothetical protein